MMTKEAHAEGLKKIAAIEAVDRASAVEIGFATAARDMGLSEDQYLELRKIAIARLQEGADKA